MTTASEAWDLPIARPPLRLPVWPLALLPLWEFYIAGIRPFDQLITMTFIAVLVLRPERQVSAERALKMLFFIAAVWIVTLRSAFLFADAWRTASGLFEGGIFALIIASASWRSEEIHRLLKALILVHACALLVQFAFYHAFHYSLNYWAWLGRPLRTELGLGMRPAGLFLEPAAFSLMMFSALTLFRITGGASAAVELLGLGTMLLSISLWGWAATIVYTLLFRWRWAATCLPFVLGAFAYVAITISRTNLKDNIILWVIIKRILYPGNDTSTHDRYSALLSVSQVWDWNLWFGEGLHTYNAVYGSNGLSFLLVAGGIVGVIVVGLLWLGILPWGRKVRGLISLGFMLSAASQWTYAWWWLWLALAGSVGCDGVKRAPRWLASLTRKHAETTP